ncbi:MAG: 3D domain-containing protein [Actinomycetia bacterium]|nr:3D domain-containing protein [Actinomycetes bacterium]
MKELIILVEIIIIILLLIASGPEAETQEQKYYLMTATAYYPGPECTHPFTDGFTAIGDIAGKGCIAIDDRNGPLKMGQMVFIEGYGIGKCNDRGSAIKDWKVDLCFDTLEEAQEWGVKLVKVYLIEGGK